MNSYGEQVNLEYWLNLFKAKEFDQIISHIKSEGGLAQCTTSSDEINLDVGSFSSNAPGGQFIIGLYALSILLIKIGVPRQLITLAPLKDYTNDRFLYFSLSPEECLNTTGYLDLCKHKVKDGVNHSKYDFQRLTDHVLGASLYHIGYGLEGYSTDTEDFIAKFDLFVSLKCDGSNVLVKISSKVYEKNFLWQMARSLIVLLRQVQDNINGDFRLFSLMGINESLALNTYNDTKVPTMGMSLGGLFDQCVKKHPTNIALVANGQSWTYQTLGKSVYKLSGMLKEKYHLKAGELVPVYFPKNEWMIISIFSILRCGAAYLPVDVEFPSERVKFIVNDANARIILSDRDNVFQIDDVETVDPRQSESWNDSYNAEDHASVKDIAYVIYTSGSTGNPKGVIIEHEGVVNRIEWMRDFYGFTVNDRILQKTTYVFDVSVWEIFLPLTCGATLVLCPQEAVMDFNKLAQFVASEKITAIHFVPSVYDAFLNSINNTAAEFFTSVRHVFASGEALQHSTVRKHHQLFTVPLHNLYGPTEASVDVSQYTTSPEDKVIAIGRPIWNMKMYILDAHNQLLPNELPGQIGLTGVGLARGYLNLVDLTNDRFIENSNSNEIIYLTGDLGLLNRSMQMEYISRIDSQVKIRGFRIELGEIEKALHAIAEIKHAVVCAFDTPGGKELMAIYTSVDVDFSVDFVLSQLKIMLPAYMIPAYYYHAENLHVTLNGKIDRKRLLAEGIRAHENVDAAIVPDSELSAKIHECWKEILGVASISYHANFFGIGGTSLRVISLHAKLQELFPASIEIHEIFSHNTIAKQTELIGKRFEISGANTSKIIEIEF